MDAFIGRHKVGIGFTSKDKPSETKKRKPLKPHSRSAYPKTRLMSPLHACDAYPLRCPDEGSLHLCRVSRRHLHEQQPVLVRERLPFRRGYAPPSRRQAHGKEHNTPRRIEENRHAAVTGREYTYYTHCRKNMNDFLLQLGACPADVSQKNVGNQSKRGQHQRPSAGSMSAGGHSAGTSEEGWNRAPRLQCSSLIRTPFPHHAASGGLSTPVGVIT